MKFLAVNVGEHSLKLVTLKLKLFINVSSVCPYKRQSSLPHEYLEIMLQERHDVWKITLHKLPKGWGVFKKFLD